MNIVKTAIILIIALIVLPVIAIKFDQSPDAVQWLMLRNSAWMMFGIAMACFVVSELTKNYSQTDKLWSIVPVLYTWYFAYESAWNPRLILMACLATLWAVRLTYNFARRGGYSWKFWSGEEDYRWGELRKNPALRGRINWSLFNLFFISLYQHALIWLFTLPMVKAYESRHIPLGIWDYLLALLVLIAIYIEWLADEQQWQYQSAKHRMIREGKPLSDYYAKGFTHTGLWAKVRHPNYSAEQTIWILFYLFTVTSGLSYLNWSMTGCLLLLLLFQGSAEFSEGITARKYPDYHQYIREVPRFFPKIF